MASKAEYLEPAEPVPQPVAVSAVQVIKSPAAESFAALAIEEVVYYALREAPKTSADPTKESTLTNSVAVAATIVGDAPVKALLTSMTDTGVNSVVVAVAMARILASFLKRAAAN